MAAPFYRVLVKDSNRDITSLIDSFTYEDSIKEDDMIVLSIKSDNPNIVDDPDLQEGIMITYVFGYKHRHSGKRLAKIEDVDPDFSGQVKMTIRAFDLGLLLKKNEYDTVWEELTASEIAKKIANRNSLLYNVEDSSYKYSSLPQGNKTDFEFLTYLATMEEGGSYRFFVKDNVLNFNKIDLKQPSIKTFRYKDPNGGVLSFKPRAGGSKKKAASQETKVVSIDRNTGEVTEQKINNSNSTDDVKLGDHAVYYDADGNKKVNISDENSLDKTGKNLVVPAKSPTQASNIANKEKKDSALEDLTASLGTEGDPFYESDKIITISNVGKKFTGNWYVAKVSHTISSNQIYSSTLSLQKNASKVNSSNSEEAKNKNNGAGPDSANKQKTLFSYDEDGNRSKNGNNI